MTDRKRRRADSRARTVCPHCKVRLHGERGLRMHLAQVHDLPPKGAAK